MPYQRILTIQDISCVGKCSLTVALPIISALGVETAIIPTAVLSTHTMFNNFTFKDLTDEIVPITNHWKEEKIGFDSIYTGYLGTIKQIDIIANLFEEFRTENNQVIVDIGLDALIVSLQELQKQFSENTAEMKKMRKEIMHYLIWAVD